jgi:hypothetical protein
LSYLGTSDMFERGWVYTRRGIQKLMAREDFPKPVFTINSGRTRIWRAIDIEDYEAANPRLKSQLEKIKHVRKYAIGQLLKNARKG